MSLRVLGVFRKSQIYLREQSRTLRWDQKIAREKSEECEVRHNITHRWFVESRDNYSPICRRTLAFSFATTIIPTTIIPTTIVPTRLASLVTFPPFALPSLRALTPPRGEPTDIFVDGNEFCHPARFRPIIVVVVVVVAPPIVIKITFAPVSIIVSMSIGKSVSSAATLLLVQPVEVCFRVWSVSIISLLFV